MSRKLQDKLALATYKSRHGLNGMNFGVIEAHLSNNLKRKGGSSVVSSSSSSSSASDFSSYPRALQSSPLPPIDFSDGFRPGEDDMRSKKRARFVSSFLDQTPTSTARKSKRGHKYSRPLGPSQSWKAAYQLADSSPIKARFQTDFRTSHGPNISFAASTLPDSPGFGPSSSPNSPSLPATTFHGELPRTPPPTRSRSLRNGKNGNANNGEEAANLLLHLHTSPSPANNKPIFLPSTPPSNFAALHSLLHGGTTPLTNLATTPGPAFNFADFVNVTPSPAQGAFSRTPGPPKTPLAAKEARRRLNFDNLLPPGGGSPTMTRQKMAGLGMELGGELVP